MRAYKIVIIVIALTMILACSSNSKTKKPQVVEKTPMVLAEETVVEATSAFESGEYAAAIEKYKTAISYYEQAKVSAAVPDSINNLIYTMNKNIANVHLVHAQDLVKQELYDDALLEYESTISAFDTIKEGSTPADSLDEKILTLYKNTAFVSRQVFDSEKALYYYDKYLAARPGDTQIMMQKFFVYKDDLKNEAQAYEILKTYALAQNDFDSSHSLGDYYRDKNDLVNAIWWYEKADSIKADENVLQKLGSIYRQRKQWEKSNNALKKFLTLNPDPVQIKTTFKLIGDNYMQLKNKPNAVEYFEKYIEFEYAENIALYICAYYNDIKSNTKALAWVNRILQNNPVQSDALFIRATIRYNTKDLKGAKADFEKLVNDAKYGKYAQQYLKSM